MAKCSDAMEAIRARPWDAGPDTYVWVDGATKVPTASQSMVATLVRTIFEQPDAEQVRAQHARVVDHLNGRFAEAAAMSADSLTRPRLRLLDTDLDDRPQEVITTELAPAV